MNSPLALWKVFGPSLVGSLSVFGLNVYHGLNNDLSRLRAEVVALQEERVNMVTEAEFESALSHIDDCLQEIEGVEPYPADGAFAA